MARRPPSGTSRGSSISVIAQVFGVWWASGVREDRWSAVLAGSAFAGVPPCPGPGVRRILRRYARFAEIERLGRVDHDSRLLELLRAQRRFDRARLGTVGVAGG